MEYPIGRRAASGAMCWRDLGEEELDEAEAYPARRLRQRRRVGDDYLLHRNADSKPFVRTKPAEVILTNERCAHDSLEAVKAQNQATE
jgi:hypothetical protein